MLGSKTGTLIGTSFVAVTNNGVHSPETMAELCTNKLVHISAQAEPHVRQQAEAFRDRLQEVIASYMRKVALNERERIASTLDASHPEIALMVRGK